MTSPEEYYKKQRQLDIKKRINTMMPDNIESLLIFMRSHLEGCAFTPDQFWEVNNMIDQIDYVLDGNEIKKGKNHEVRSDNTRPTRNRKDNDSPKDS